VIAETKTAEGEGAWDRAFADRGREPVSVSKYRLGSALAEKTASAVKRLFRGRAARP